MAIGVMKARKHFGVEFPDLYAKETNPNKAAFDAVQRGHQNVLENIPIFLAVQAFVALAAGPLVAAGLITVYTVAKVGGGGGRGWIDELENQPRFPPPPPSLPLFCLTQKLPQLLRHR